MRAKMKVLLATCALLLLAGSLAFAGMGGHGGPSGGGMSGGMGGGMMAQGSGMSGMNPSDANADGTGSMQGMGNHMRGMDHGSGNATGQMGASSMPMGRNSANQ